MEEAQQAWQRSYNQLTQPYEFPDEVENCVNKQNRFLCFDCLLELNDNDEPSCVVFVSSALKKHASWDA